MLEKIDLTKKIDKQTYKKLIPGLLDRLYTVQKGTWEAGIPVAILFEGWDAAGKGTSIQSLTQPLDPRGFKLYPIRAARTYEKNHPWLWRFWLKIPARGEWAIYDRSWYGRVLVERVENLVSESEWRRAYRDIADFERTIADDGCQIIKFFLHISKEEQKRRFEKLIKDPLTAWHVAAEDWEHHRMYDEWLLAYEEAFEHTDAEWGPWTIVEATDRRFTRVKIYQTVIRTLEERLGIIPPEETSTITGEVVSDGQETIDHIVEEETTVIAGGIKGTTSLNEESIEESQVNLKRKKRKAKKAVKEVEAEAVQAESAEAESTDFKPIPGGDGKGADDAGED